MQNGFEALTYSINLTMRCMSNRFCGPIRVSRYEVSGSSTCAENRHWIDEYIQFVRNDPGDILRTHVYKSTLKMCSEIVKGDRVIHFLPCYMFLGYHNSPIPWLIRSLDLPCLDLLRGFHEEWYVAPVQSNIRQSLLIFSNIWFPDC
ncbi:hypothetical protein AVEN_248923-1 [Araneus ventricosus]|uniref:Uncharacterized protein n=1 Tax=Araneus ventricosus TaxID=182803 RepID=A0A4Y2SLZ1_ARAVE|nr:hypothetical protein AVEN_248923-1 [Araneus ventricosus]